MQNDCLRRFLVLDHQTSERSVVVEKHLALARCVQVRDSEGLDRYNLAWSEFDVEFFRNVGADEEFSGFEAGNAAVLGFEAEIFISDS